MATTLAAICVCGIVVAILLGRSSSYGHRNRSVWVRQWIRNRQAQGAYHQLMKELEMIDTSSYRNFVRMDVATFEELLCKVAPLITRADTNMRQAITAGERLAVTLSFLATGKYIYILS